MHGLHCMVYNALQHGLYCLQYQLVIRRKQYLCYGLFHAAGGAVGVSRHLYQDVSLGLQQHLGHHLSHLHMRQNSVGEYRQQDLPAYLGHARKRLWSPTYLDVLQVEDVVRCPCGTAVVYLSCCHMPGGGMHAGPSVERAEQRHFTGCATDPARQTDRRTDRDGTCSASQQD